MGIVVGRVRGEQWRRGGQRDRRAHPEGTSYAPSLCLGTDRIEEKCRW